MLKSRGERNEIKEQNRGRKEGCTGGHIALELLTVTVKKSPLNIRNFKKITQFISQNPAKRGGKWFGRGKFRKGEV